MHKLIISLGLIFFATFLSGCEKDNYAAPSETISGTIQYNNMPVNVRNGRIELELWQEGFAQKIPVFTNQEGAFSAKVFPGNYRLVLVKGSYPWQAATDTLRVTAGSPNSNITVRPYYYISNPQISKSGNTVSGTFNLENVAKEKEIEYVAIYLSRNSIVDVNNQMAVARKNKADLAPMGQAQSISINVPDNLASSPNLYGRIGVKTMGVEELLYSPVVKL